MQDPSIGFNQAYCNIPRFMAKNVCGSEMSTVGKNMVERPQVVNWLSTMHHNYQGALPSQEVDEKLEESVDCESLGRLA
jgi:hypothetical protein